MKQSDLFKMELGEYKLTDNIDNYKYQLKIGLTEDKKRIYTIREFGSLHFSAHITLFEEYIENDNGENEKILTACSGVGGLNIHSSDCYSFLSELRLCDVAS